jgi:hypothetical protein
VAWRQTPARTHLGVIILRALFPLAEYGRAGGLAPTMTVLARLASLPSVQTRRG